MLGVVGIGVWEQHMYWGVIGLCMWRRAVGAVGRKHCPFWYSLDRDGDRSTLLDTVIPPGHPLASQCHKFQ